jgi:voltage-gated potassium channel
MLASLRQPSGFGHSKVAEGALWWAVTTVSTVGYGDKYPVTPEDRIIAVVLMVLGIGLFGLIAATLLSFFIEEQHIDDMTADINALAGSC